MRNGRRQAVSPWGHRLCSTNGSPAGDDWVSRHVATGRTIEMTYSDNLCPSPEWCIDNFLDVIDRYGSSAPESIVAAMRAWLRGLREDPAALEVLERARQAGADVPRLMFGAGYYLFDPSWLDGPLGKIRIDLPRNAVFANQDIGQALAQAETQERLLGMQTTAGDEFRRIKAMLNQLNEVVESEAGQPRRSLVPDGQGGLVEKTWIATGAGVAITTGEIGLAQGKLAKVRGTPGDHALYVMLILVVGHLEAISDKLKPSLVVDLLLRGLRVGVTGGADDAEQAMRRRFYRCHDANRQEHWKRARIMAEILGLRFKPA